ncbi:MAG: hypothetical protein MZV65_27795, partial [Chromatiales bacterium]|nr:hypothetical protein [Chromatiales bacterium]
PGRRDAVERLDRRGAECPPLTVTFAPISLCDRIRLTGTTAALGTRIFTIPGAAYNDSTRAYSGPENSNPLTVYLDQDPETAAPGWTLKIHWPNQNWYPAFDWPGPIYTDKPPFGDDEQRPAGVLFELKESRIRAFAPGHG